MTGFAGALILARLALRRDRVRLTVWVLALGAMASVTASSIDDLYTPAQLAEYAVTVQGNQAVIAMSGPSRALDTYGGRIAFEIWQFSVAIALLAVLTVGRHARAEEEAGRGELLGAQPIGRHARSAAAVMVGMTASTAVGAVVALGLLGSGLPMAGSIAMGAAFAATGTCFSGLALLTAQLAERTRVATGVALASLALAYLARAVGDVGDGRLSWATPMGWMQATRPYSGERWWPLALLFGAGLGLAAAALAVESRRDVGAGLLPSRTGPPSAGRGLTGPMSLAWRLHRGGLFAWAVGLALGGAAFGSVASSADDLVGDNDAIRNYLAQLGGADLSDVFLVTVLVYLALATAGFAIQTALRPSIEESTGRADVILAAGTPRARWLGGQLSVTVLGSTLLMAAGGLGTGVAYALSTSDASQVPRLLGAALTFVPAVWVTAALAAALHGLLPRAGGVAWALLVLGAVVAVLGGVLDIPDLVRDLSPFTHVPSVPAEPVAMAPLVALTGVAAVLMAVGVLGFRRRDVG